MTPPIHKLVSLETANKVKIYEGLLLEWNRRTSLVQEDTLSEFYSRHILDSLQVIPIIQQLLSPTPSCLFSEFPDYLTSGFKFDDLDTDIKKLSMIDVGTGAGFPGLVLAICGFDGVTLCESNHKKCVFLEEVARQTKTKINILNERAENIREKFEVVLSRACTDLNALCYMMKHLSNCPTSIGIFHKGRSWKNELEDARNFWEFEAHPYQSLTSLEAVVLIIQKLVMKS